MSTKEQREHVELLQGALDLLILGTLVLGAAHGHAIAKAIELRSDDVLQVDQGSLYPRTAPAHQAGMEFGPGRHLGEQSQVQVLPPDGQGTASI